MIFETTGAPHLAHSLDLHHLVVDHNGEHKCCCGYDPSGDITVRTREQALARVRRHLAARIPELRPEEDTETIKMLSRDMARMRAEEATNSINVRTDVLGVYFTSGSGTIYALDQDLGGGQLVMPRRDKALALALLELATETVRRSDEP